MVQLSAVYKIMADESEVVYVGSSVDCKARFNQHKNIKTKHGPFGRWVHANGLQDQIKMIILEVLKLEDHDELKKELKRREYLWKERLTPTFGQMDGLCFQDAETRRLANCAKSSRYRNSHLDAERERCGAKMRRWRSIPGNWEKEQARNRAAYKRRKAKRCDGPAAGSSADRSVATRRGTSANYVKWGFGKSGCGWLRRVFTAGTRPEPVHIDTVHNWITRITVTNRG